MSWSFNTNNVQDYATWINGFTSDECEDLKAQFYKLPMYQSVTRSSILGMPNMSIRNSKITWVPPTGFDDIYEKISYICKELNNKYFGFDLDGFDDNLQFSEYSAPNGNYTYHMDKGIGIASRKLSFTLQLSDPSTYDGGDFEILLGGENPIKLDRTQGTMFVFPSYILHRVTPVTKGVRNSLVGWITGKPFK